jgi:hypothetical protein
MTSDVGCEGYMSTFSVSSAVPRVRRRYFKERQGRGTK